MSNLLLRSDQIVVGMPLPFDTFDGEGHLLLRRGHVIASADQLERLLARGMYMDSSALPAPHALDRGDKVPGSAPRPGSVKVSAFELVGEVQRDLGVLLAEAAPSHFTARVEALALKLQRAFKVDADATLATIQWLHEGRYTLRRQIHGAILIELLLSHAGDSEAHRRQVMCAALTMNVAMLDLQDDLFHQATPPLPEQLGVVHAHATRGVEQLQALGVTDDFWLRVVAEHHETIDGKGHPMHKTGEQICREAQCLSLADRYGAMATGRAYRPPALPTVVLKQIFQDKGVNPAYSGLLVKTVGIYPPGSLVVLANGDFAVVTKRTQSANHPVVRCVKTFRNEVLAQPRKRLTSESQFHIARLITSTELGLKLDPALLWDEGFEMPSA